MRWSVAAVLLAGSVSCKSGGDSTPPIVVATVTVSGNDAAILPGATVQLSARASTATGTSVAGASMVWSSSDATVATVSSTGLVAAVAAGTATVSATSGTVSGTTVVRVNAGGVVSSAGGSVTAAAGNVALTIPAGAVSSTLPITVTPKPDTMRTSHTASPGYLFGPTGTQFAQPVTMALKFDAATLPAHTDKASLRVARLVNGSWDVLTEGVQVDSATNTVRAQTRSFSTYAVVRDPCLPQDGSATVIGGSIATDDCLYKVAGRRSDYYTLTPPANRMLVLKSSGALDGLFGLKQATADATTGTVYNSDFTGRELRFVGNGQPVQLFVSGRDSTKLGSYTFTKAAAVTHACPSTSLGIPYIVLMPGASFSDAVAPTGSCAFAVQYSPIPAAIGKPLLGHYYAVKLDAGRRYTVTTTGMAGQSALSVFSNGLVAQDVSTTAGTRSVTFTAAASTYYTIEISSGGFENANFTGAWINPTFNYTVSVSASAATTCVITPYSVGTSVTGSWASSDCQNATAFGDTDAAYDQYEINLSAQQNVRFELTGATGRSLRIRRKNTTQYVGLPLSSSFTTVNGNTLVQRHLLAAGDYIVEVQAPGTTTGSYTLNSAIDNTDIVCRPIVQGSIGMTFAGELNTSTDCASPAAPGTFEDWIVMPLTKGDKIRITLTTTDMAAGLVLRDDRNGPASPTLTSAFSTTPGTVSLDWTVTFDTYHEIVIYRRNSATPYGRYTISVQRLP
ncbi:MAG: Ig-like domain-containing protein [Gemmatimonadaceae bacterium]